MTLPDPWEALAPHLPEDLCGWTALDIGWDTGHHSLELARRGARVTAIEVDERSLRHARWEDLAATGRTWDLVLFLGVFPHLRHPLLGLDVVARCVSRELVFQALAGEPVLESRHRLPAPGWPVTMFLERELARWWAPTAAGCEAMLRSVGLEPVARPLEGTWLCEPKQRLPW